MSTLRKILIDKQKSCKSVWFMRQAGRYLPEFRKIRSQNQNFIKLCLNSKLSSEITLQPIKRFNLDSAIIFSDILMTPYSLGQEIKFRKDEGPKLNNFNLERFLDLISLNSGKYLPACLINHTDLQDSFLSTKIFLRVLIYIIKVYKYSFCSRFCELLI